MGLLQKERKDKALGWSVFGMSKLLPCIVMPIKSPFKEIITYWMMQNCRYVDSKLSATHGQGALIPWNLELEHIESERVL